MDQQTNQWPADKAVTQYPDRLTVEVDAGDIQAVYEWASAAFFHLEAGRIDEARNAVENIYGDTLRDRLMWDPAEKAIEALGVDFKGLDHGELWAALAAGNDWAREARAA